MTRRAVDPTNTLGEPWSYSSTNHFILGLLIERLTGRPYAGEVTRHILRLVHARRSRAGTVRRLHPAPVAHRRAAALVVVRSERAPPT